MSNEEKKTVYLFVFDGYADYETSMATAGITKSDRYKFATIGLTKKMLTSMSGLNIAPDQVLSEMNISTINSDSTALLILPGGPAWESKTNGTVHPLIEQCITSKVPIAAICGSTVFLADIGLLDSIAHTSNQLEYLAGFSKKYRGHQLYQDVPSVATENLITASGTAAVEFASDVFDKLEISNEKAVSEWFQYFQKKTEKVS